MALQIIENNEIFYVKGKINTSTKKHFINHFDNILNDRDKIILNIEEVDEIDVDGLKALKTLLKIANRNSKTFFITGKGCKEIYEDYQSNEVA